MKVEDLRTLIQTTLQAAPKYDFGRASLYSVDVEELLCATCAQESHLGVYRQQIGGPALGIFQMEPATWEDLWRNYIMYNADLSQWVRSLQLNPPLAQREMITNDSLAIAMARLLYFRAPEAIPASTDLQGLWTLYKKRWNTPLGAATWSQFVVNYAMYVNGPAH